MTNIESIMTKAVVTIKSDNTLQDIQNIFNNAKFHHLLVMAHKKPVGIISDRDLLKALSPFADTVSELPRDSATLNKKAHQIMTRNIITLLPENSVVEAINLLLENDVSCLPVVTKDSELKGIVSWKDLLRAFNAAYSEPV